jgi:hypothetical protein
MQTNTSNFVSMQSKYSVPSNYVTQFRTTYYSPLRRSSFKHFVWKYSPVAMYDVQSATISHLLVSFSIYKKTLWWSTVTFRNEGMEQAQGKGKKKENADGIYWHV